MSSIFELPAQLEAFYKMRDFCEAVNCYRKTAPLLAKYSSSPMFLKINQDTREIIKKIKIMVRQDVDNPDSSIELIGSSIGLLLELEETPVELSRLYIKRYFCNIKT
jgi:hypothetical protein